MSKQLKYYILVPALVLGCAFIYLFLTGESEASKVREQVVRFHVVADSNEEEAQTLKLKVRDGVFTLVEQLFAGCSSQGEALAVAKENQEKLTAEAQRILLENGSDEAVTVEIGQRYFPTKTYGSLSFPAGRYQAVSIRIGEAKGENFWCVLYPALCLAPAVAEETSEQEMLAVVGEETTSFLKKSQTVPKIKFALVEWFEQIKEKICK
ncbi:MAG: stage II sporulation protein R [Clostridia bacterium]|nr:stage II sporulation protein R [Clostridia bacterium]